jgi:hypothetical protein
MNDIDHPSKTPSDSHRLSRYWGAHYAASIEANKVLPPEVNIAVVGFETDGMMNEHAPGLSPMEHLAWAATYMGYPCDAIWVSANYRINETAVLNYTHLLPTNESIVTMIAKVRGKWKSKVLDSEEHLAFFEPVRDACHVFDNEKIREDEVDNRRYSRQLVDEGDWEVLWFPPCSILDAARSASGR